MAKPPPVSTQRCYKFSAIEYYLWHFATQSAIAEVRCPTYVWCRPPGTRLVPMQGWWMDRGLSQAENETCRYPRLRLAAMGRVEHGFSEVRHDMPLYAFVRVCIVAKELVFILGSCNLI